MNRKFVSLGASALLAAAVLIPLSASAADQTCVDFRCEVVFSFTGSPELFQVPQGVQEIQFEVNGASGGRGGFGGQVTGTLVNLPSEFYVVVGAAGGVGSKIAGGYNGGGNAGGNRGNEGAGGGASDIRLTTELADRIIVAGGGGGAGGYSGAPGGAGGLFEAANGQSGQGSGGGGGTQTTGGFAGASNGGSQLATQGGFGQGGTGGSSWNAGGGGGGGGWFGGGGGGADDDDCCSDGGGGGGGSSYVNELFASNVDSLAGVQAGNGWVTLRYEIAPFLVASTATQGLERVANFELVMSAPVGQVDASAFLISGLGCLISEVLGDGSTIDVQVSGCEVEQVVLTLLANSIGESVLGPTSDLLLSLSLDLTGPVFTISSYPARISQSNLAIEFTLTDSVTQVSSNSFSVQGCDGLELSSSSSILELTGCHNGDASLLVLAGTFADEFGNLSPNQGLSFSFTVDQAGPVPQFSPSEIIGDGPFTYSALLEFDEWATFSDEAIIFSAPQECVSNLSGEGSLWFLTTYCGHGEITWQIKPDLVFDDLGNAGSSPDVEIAFSNPVPEPPVVQLPTPTPPPVQEAPTPVLVEIPVVVEVPVIVEAEPEVQFEVPVFESSTSEVIVESELEPITSETKAAVAPEPPSAIAKAPSSKAIAAQSEEVVIEETISAEVISGPQPPISSPSEPDNGTPLAAPISGPAIELKSDASVPWLIPTLFGFVVLLGLGIWRFSGK